MCLYTCVCLYVHVYVCVCICMLEYVQMCVTVNELLHFKMPTVKCSYSHHLCSYSPGTDNYITVAACSIHRETRKLYKHPWGGGICTSIPGVEGYVQASLGWRDMYKHPWGGGICTSIPGVEGYVQASLGWRDTFLVLDFQKLYCIEYPNSSIRCIRWICYQHKGYVCTL